MSSLWESGGKPPKSPTSPPAPLDLLSFTGTMSEGVSWRDRLAKLAKVAQGHQHQKGQVPDDLDVQSFIDALAAALGERRSVVASGDAVRLLFHLEPHAGGDAPIILIPQWFDVTTRHSIVLRTAVPLAATPLNDADRLVLRLMRDHGLATSEDDGWRIAISGTVAAAYDIVFLLCQQEMVCCGFNEDRTPRLILVDARASEQPFYKFSLVLTEECVDAVDSSAPRQQWHLWGRLTRGEACPQPGRTAEHTSAFDPIDLWSVSAILPDGIVLADDRMYKIANPHCSALMRLLQEGGSLVGCWDELGSLLFQLENHIPGGCAIALPDRAVCVEKITATARPNLYLLTKTGQPQALSNLCQERLVVRGAVSFEYFGKEFPANLDHTTERLRQPIAFTQENCSHDTRTLVTLIFQDGVGEEQHVRYLARSGGTYVVRGRDQFSFEPKSLIDNVYRLLKAGWTVWAEKVKLSLLEGMSVKLDSEGEWFDLAAHTAEGEKISTWQLINFLKKKSLFIRLGDGTLALPPEEWYRRLQQLTPLGHQRPNDAWSFGNLVADRVDQVLDQAGPAALTRTASFQTTVDKMRSISGLSPLIEPVGFGAVLRPYQRYGLAWLKFLDDMGLGGCLADEMGLGKTVQTLAFLAWKKANPAVGDARSACLIIAPKSILPQWQDEAERLAPSLRVAMLARRSHGHRVPSPGGIDFWENLLTENDVLLASYGWIRRHHQTLAGIRFGLIVVDEAQLIKNPESQIHRAVASLAAARRLAISGTPIENHVSDLFTIFSFLNPALPPLRPTTFPPAARTESPEAAEEHDSTERRMVETLRPLTLRRLKRDVLDDLPEKLEQIVRLPMERHQREQYDGLKEYYQKKLQTLAADPPQSYSLVFLEAILRMRQLSCHPILLPQNSARHDLTSNKLNYLTFKVPDLIASGHKILIFSQFVSFLDLIHRQLLAKGVKCLYVDGKTERRQEIVRQFQTEDIPMAFLLSLRVGGLGLNLTAADYCFIMDPWWNPAVEMQAIDRVHRIGRRRAVNVYKLISRDSVEEKMLNLHGKKIEQAGMLQTTDASFLAQLSPDDFRMLLS